MKSCSIFRIPGITNAKIDVIQKSQQDLKERIQDPFKDLEEQLNRKFESVKDDMQVIQTFERKN